MKYMLLAVAFLSVGFIGGYLFYDATVDELDATPPSTAPTLTKTIVEHQPAAAGRQSSVDASLDLDTVAEQPTIFKTVFEAHRLAADASPDQLETLLEEVIGSDDPLYNVNIAGIFIERWTEFNPEGALAFIADHPQMDQEHFTAHVLTSWVRHDPDRAFDYFSAIDDRRLKFAVGARLLEDPTLNDSGLIADIESELGPAADALASAMRLRRLPPQEAFGEALNMTGSARRSALARATVRWANFDAEGLMRRIASLQNREERHFVMRTALSRIARHDPDRALELLNLYAPDEPDLESVVLHTFARNDPVRALPWAERNMDATGDMGVMSTLLAQWVQQDPRAAINYAQSLTPERRGRVFRQMASSYARSHPDEAFNWALDLGPQFQNVRNIALSAISHSNADLVERNIDRITDTQLRTMVIQQLATQKSRRDVTSAIDWINRNTLPDSEPRQRALVSVAQQLARRDPAAATSLLDRLPNGPVKENARRSVAFRWALREPGRIEEIISKLNLDPASAERLRQRQQHRTGTVDIITGPGSR